MAYICFLTIYYCFNLLIVLPYICFGLPGVISQNNAIQGCTLSLCSFLFVVVQLKNKLGDDKYSRTELYLIKREKEEEKKGKNEYPQKPHFANSSMHLCKKQTREHFRKPFPHSHSGFFLKCQSLDLKRKKKVPAKLVLRCTTLSCVWSPSRLLMP